MRELRIKSQHISETYLEIIKFENPATIKVEMQIDENGMCSLLLSEHSEEYVQKRIPGAETHPVQHMYRNYTTKPDHMFEGAMSGMDWDRYLRKVVHNLSK